jgi:predicted anti-sigma-YlaC factor YlaD
MTCSEFNEWLPDYTAGELSSVQQRHLERHLEDCSSCRCYLSTYEQTIQLGRAAHRYDDTVRPGDVPEDFVELLLVLRRIASKVHAH